MALSIKRPGKKRKKTTTKRATKSTSALARFAPKRSMKTKYFGLSRLQKICKSTKTAFLEYFLFTDPEKFKFNSKALRSKGFSRLLIRSDPVMRGGDLTRSEWAACPRTEFPINVSVDEIKAWMREAQREHKGRFGTKLKFIVHPVRPKEEISKTGTIQWDLKTGKAKFIVRFGGTKSKVWRQVSKGVVEREVEIKNGKVKVYAAKLHIPPLAAHRLVSVLELVLKTDAVKQHHSGEISYCIYEDDPTMPEFYDLLYKQSPAVPEEYAPRYK